MKTYLLVRNKVSSHYWYGYYEDEICNWSGWDNLEDIFNKELLPGDNDDNTSYNTFLEYTQTPEAKIQIILTSNKPITYKQIQDEYPELLI